MMISITFTTFFLSLFSTCFTGLLLPTYMRRKRNADGTPETVETVEEQIVRQLTEKRIKELDRSLAETKEEYLAMKKEMELVEKGGMDDKLLELAQASESAPSKEHASEDKVPTASSQPVTLVNTVHVVQSASQNHSEKPVLHKAGEELKVEIKQELLSPTLSQRNSVQPPVEPETKEERTSRERGKEDDSKLPQENSDIGENGVKQGEMEVCRTEATSDVGAAEQVKPSVEEPMEAEVVEETETSNSVAPPVEEEKMEVDENPELSAQQEGGEKVEKAKEEQIETVEEKKMKYSEGDESHEGKKPHEHKAPTVVELPLPEEIKEEKEADEQNEEEEIVTQVPCRDVLATTAASPADTKPESVSMETSSVQSDVTQPTPEKLASIEQKQEEEQPSPSVMSPERKKQELTEAPVHELPELEPTTKEEENKLPLGNKKEVPSASEENETQLPSKSEAKEVLLDSKKEEKEVPLSSKKEEKEILQASKKEEKEVQFSSKKEEKEVSFSSEKEEGDEATEVNMKEDKQTSVEEKLLVKEAKEEDAAEEQAPSPRITRARRREVSQTPEAPTRIVKAEVETPRGRRIIKVIRRGRMATRLSRQRVEPPAATDPETSVDSRDVTDQESEEEPASSISSAVPSPALSQSDPDQENLQAMRQWRKTIMLVWRHAAQHKYAALFLHPVKEEDAPGYHDVVLRPMDLSSIKKNIENGVIKTDIEFQREMLLMFQNALMYNSSDHDVYRMADEMRSDVMENIQEYLLTQMMVHSSGTKALRNRDSKKVESLEEKKKLYSEESQTVLKKRRTRADD